MKVPTDEFALRYTPFIGNVCNYLRAICYEQFVWIFPIISPFLFSSIPFIMHSTNNTLNHQQLGASVGGQECTGERGPDGRGLTDCQTHSAHPHAPTLRHCGLERRSSQGSITGKPELCFPGCAQLSPNTLGNSRGVMKMQEGKAG